VLTPAAALDPLGVAAGLGAALSTALGIVLTRRFGPPPAPLLVATGWQLMTAGALLLPLMLAVEGTPPVPDAGALAGFAWLALAGTALAYALWFRGLAGLAPTRVAFLVLLSPLVAATAGWVVLGQSLSALQLTGMGVALASIAAAQGASLPRPRRRVTVPAAPAPSPPALRPDARPA
jgi:probable blue pigment (indigoidine) exporter